MAQPLYLVTAILHNVVLVCLQTRTGTPPCRTQTHTLTQPLRCVCRAPLFKCTHAPDLKDQSQLHFLCSPYTSTHTYSRAHALKHCACAYTRVSASTRTPGAQALQCIYARSSNFLIQSKSLKCQKQGKGACSCNLSSTKQCLSDQNWSLRQKSLLHSAHFSEIKAQNWPNLQKSAHQHTPCPTVNL